MQAAEKIRIAGAYQLCAMRVFKLYGYMLIRRKEKVIKIGQRSWNELEWQAGLQGFAAMMYRDEAVIWRNQPEIRPNGSTVMGRVRLGAPVPCRISRVSSRKDAFHQELPQQELEYEARLYLHPDSDICAGDLVEVKRGGSGWARKFLAGDVFVYVSHMEVPLHRSAEA